MLQKLQRRYALSEQGARDLVKGCLACLLQNLSFMVPVGLLYLLVGDLLAGGGRHHPALYLAGIVVCVGPVSYTHLDVYKRQSSWCSPAKKCPSTAL